MKIIDDTFYALYIDIPDISLGQCILLDFVRANNVL
jgi:hypothetical protein